MSTIILESELICPNCGFTKQKSMPTDACRVYYECIDCKTLLRPLSGHCYVYCSYGSVLCPPDQEPIS